MNKDLDGTWNGGIVTESVNGGGSAGDRPSVGSAQGVWKAFGETQALSDVSLDVRAGECHALVGRNGAGKSTLVAILTGFFINVTVKHLLMLNTKI